MSVRSRSAGFPLVETLVTAAIFASLATLASLAVFLGTTRVRVSNAAFGVGALYTVTPVHLGGG